jgi:hypothetical protein
MVEERGVPPIVLFLAHDGNLIATPYLPASEDAGKDAFPRHDAIPGHIVYRTFIVAFFTDLRDLHQGRLTKLHACPYRHFWPFDPRRSDIFCKVTKGDIKAPFAGTFDTFGSEKAYLPVPRAGMGIPFKAMILYEDSLFNLCLTRSLFFTNSDRVYFHINISFT